MPDVAPVRTAVAGIILAFVAGPAVAGERPWIEVRSPRFTVVSDAGEDEARATAVHFEKMRGVFRALFPWGARDDSRPFVVLAVRDHEWLRRFDPNARASIYAAGPDADFVAVHARQRNADSNTFARYALGALQRGFGTQIPPWYQEGIVHVFGSSLVVGNRVEVGHVIQGHLTTLVVETALASGRSGTVQVDALPAGAIVPLERLILARPTELHQLGAMQQKSFAAQSWVFVHFLMFGEKGAHRARFDRLGALLAAGRSGHDATEEALGNVNALEAAYREYIRKKKLHFQRLELAVPDSARWPAREVTAAELATLERRFQKAVR